MYTQKIRQQAIELRNEGKSLKEISSKLGIAKSTASYWLTGYKNKGAFGSMNRSDWLKKIRIKSHLAVQARIQKRDSELKNIAQLQINKISTDHTTQMAILSALYWAEGAKPSPRNRSTISFANTDPSLIKLYVSLFRNCFKLDEAKFRLRIHLHAYHQESEAKSFWSKLTNIPIEQIGKVYWKKTPDTGKKYRHNLNNL